MRVSAALLIIPVAFLSLGATDCDQFHEVTVPATDSSPPMAVGSAYRGYLTGNWSAWGDPLMHSWETDGGTLYRNGSEDMTLVAVASSIDEGGAKRVRMTWTLQHECCRLTGTTWSACQTTTTPETTTEDQQQGTVGSHVSSGVYVYQPIVEPAQCPTGKRTRRLTLDFRVRAWNFHGGQSASGPHRIIWDAPID